MGGSTAPEPGLQRPTAIALVLGLALAASATGASASVLDGPGSDLPVLVDRSFEQATAVSVTVELTDPALYRIDLIGEGPRQGSVISLGFVDFDDERQYDGSAVVTSFASQQRHRTTVDGEALPVPTHAVPEHGDPAAAVVPDDESSPRPCPLACASRLELPERTEAGLAHHALWIGGVGETRLQVIGDANVADVHVQTGTPHAAGSEDFQQGAANAQHQPTTRAADERAFVGAKAVHEARHEVTVGDELYGVTGLAEFKTACAGACVGASTARAACSVLLPTDCRAAQIDWQGPHGGNETSHHVFVGTPGGDYAFQLERALDAYASDTPVVADYAYADPGEHHAYVSAADLPRPPLPPR